MRSVKLWLILLFSLTCIAATPPDNANQLIEVALQPSQLEHNLQQLTDEIGGRVPGTQAMQRAVQWGTQAFTVAGADSVHTESFTIPNSWSEGATEMKATTFYEAGDAKVGGFLPTLFRVRAVVTLYRKHPGGPPGTRGTVDRGRRAQPARATLQAEPSGAAASRAV